MKTFATIAGIAVAASSLATDPPKQYGSRQKPFEATIGAAYFVGDLNDIFDFSFGFVGGLDYYMAPMGGGGGGMTNMQTFAGIRGWFGSKSGQDVTTFGAHYGVKANLGAMSAGMSSGLYFKGGLGYYRTDYQPGPQKWGFGGFAGIGWEQGVGGFGLEVGFQFAPSAGGVNNQAFYGAVSFRF